MVLPSETDRELIARALAGKTDAFDGLMRRHRDLVFNVSLRMLGNRDEAEDIVQQVFLEAFRHLADFHHGAQFSTWLYSIALNRSRNHLRTRRSRSFVSIDARSDDDDHKIPLQIPDQSPATDTVMEKQSDMTWLRANIQTLPEDYRVIVTLHYFEHQPLQAIATHLNRPLATVKVYLHRARKLLMERLQADPLHRPEPPTASRR